MFKRIPTVSAALAAALVAQSAYAGTCIGNCGTLSPNGVVTAPPGATTYSYVSTYLGVDGAGQLSGIGGTNGTTYITPAFAANSGDLLNFNFDYVTSDGAGYDDYAWAALLDTSLNPVAILFTARTEPAGPIVPGVGLPAANATLTPSPVTIISGGPMWDPLGPWSGTCYDAGCGYTGWVNSKYTIPTGGNYVLSFGVSNWIDTVWDSGMAFSGITIAGTPIDDAVPEPATWAMMLLGFGFVGGAMRTAKRRQKAAFSYA